MDALSQIILKVSFVIFPYAETQISSTWSMGAGEDSKEFDVQTQRNQREKETFYSCLQDIPPNPKEPWDREMDFDDTLTPEIPTEQPPDADAEEGSSCAPIKDAEEAPASKAAADVTCASPISDGPPEPDLELLAVLLKNPDLVFALTSNQGKSLTSEEMVVLLDMLKRNGVGLTGMLNDLAHPKVNSSHKTRSQEQEPPTSLPSPTPPSEAARVRLLLTTVATAIHLVLCYFARCQAHHLFLFVCRVVGGQIFEPFQRLQFCSLIFQATEQWQLLLLWFCNPLLLQFFQWFLGLRLLV